MTLYLHDHLLYYMVQVTWLVHTMSEVKQIWQSSIISKLLVVILDFWKPTIIWLVFLFCDRLLISVEFVKFRHSGKW